MTVTADRRRAHLSGCHLVDSAGRVRLHVPPDSALVALVDDGEVPALMELTDVAAVAMRHRVRAQVTLAGRLSRAESTGRRGLRFTTVAARLTEGPDAHVTDVDGDAFADAEPDPLAHTETDLLCHLFDSHRDAVDRLARLVPAHHLHGVRAVLPLRVDRYGIVLRLEHARRDLDVRLPFGAPLRTATDAPARMLELLAGGNRCPRRLR